MITVPYHHLGAGKSLLGLHKIDNPSWVTCEDECFVKSYSVLVNSRSLKYEDKVELVLSRYYPKSSLGIGFDRFFLVDKRTHNPVPMNDSMIREIGKSIKEYASELSKCQFSVDDEFRFSGISGHLLDDEVIQVSTVICEMYDKWKEFPNEKSMESVKEMHKIRDKIVYGSVQVDEQERNIRSWRSEISRLRESIKEAEDRINKAYEEMASDIDALESHGYKYDFNEREKDDYNNKSKSIPYAFSDIALTPKELEEIEKIGWDSESEQIMLSRLPEIPNEGHCGVIVDGTYN